MSWERKYAEPSIVGWDDEAACKGHGDVFIGPAADETEAKRICRRCPVIAACLDDALEHEPANPDAIAAVRAAMTPVEFDAFRRKRRPA